MAADRKLYIELVVDDKGAAKTLALVDQGVRKVGATARSTTVDLGSFEKSMTRATAVGSFLGTTLANVTGYLTNLARRGISTVVDEFQRGIKLSIEFNNAFLGLGSVARHFGVDMTDARAAAQRL